MFERKQCCAPERGCGQLWWKVDVELREGAFNRQPRNCLHVPVLELAPGTLSAMERKLVVAHGRCTESSAAECRRP